MILDRVRTLATRDVGAFVWSSLHRFRNIDHTTDIVSRLHKVSAKHRSNVAKQAKQLRYSLVQAEEYFLAAKSVSLATKPLLLYYGTMSLALAEILFKHSGDASLDRAREKHAHHGLELKISGKFEGVSDLRQSASRLGASPAHNAQGRFGTFELWHQAARQAPICGKFKHTFPKGYWTERHEVVSFPHDDRLELLAGEGVSLLTCFQALPDLAFSLSRLGVAPALHVAHVEGGSDEHKKQKWHRMVLHGDASSEIATGVWDRIKVKADDARVELRRWDGSSGGVVQWSSKLDETDPSITYPTAIQRTAERFSFCANIGSLNEFGLYYVALYILGNYARYYPDQWMMEVETASPLALMASELLSGAERRLPLMTLMELDRIFYLERD